MFWKYWSKGEKALLIALSTLVIVCFAAFIYFDSQGLYNVLGWDTYVDVNNTSVVFDQFSKYMLDFNIETENYAVSQYFLPTKYKITPLIGTINFIVTAFIAVTALAAVSMLKEIKWFAGLTSIFLAWVALLHLDTIGIMGIYNKGVVIASIALFVGIAFYFHTFANHKSLLFRCLIFYPVLAIYIYVIEQFSDLKTPLFLLSVNSYFVAVGVATLFIMYVSHDILTGIVFINAKTRSFNPRSNIFNLLGLSSLYMLTPVIMFLREINAVTVNLSYFNVYYLLLVSTVLGLWAQSKRAHVVKNKVPYHPIGGILMICGAVITFNTIAHAHATCNYTITEYFENIILFSHVAFGFAFLMYTLFNFSPLLLKNIDIRPYIFAPKKDIQYWLVRFMGLGILVTILHIKNFRAPNEIMAGYNNLKGDVAYYLEDYLMSSYYYTQGDKKISFNFKSNYPLSELNVQKKKFQNAKENIKRVLISTPHPLTYSSSQYIHELNQDAFYNIWNLEEGAKRFPDSYQLKNNLAITYEKEGIKKEQCLSLYEEALSLSNNSSLVESNLVAFCIKNNLFEEARALLDKVQQTETSAGFETNKHAVLNKLGAPNTPIKLKSYFGTGELNNLSLSYLNNAVFRSKKGDLEIAKIISQLEELPENEYYLTDLNYLKAIITFYAGNQAQAKKEFDQILIDCPTNLYPYYANIFGLLTLKAGADDIANEYFRKSYKSQQFNGVNRSPLYFALTSSHKITSDSLSKVLGQIALLDSNYSAYAQNLAEIVSLKDLNDVTKLNDYEKIQYLELRKEQLTRDQNQRLLESFELNDLKALAATVLMEKCLKQEKLEEARFYYSMIPGKITNPFVASKMNVQFLSMLFQSKLYSQLTQEAESMDFVDEDKSDLFYILAKTAIENRDLEKAEQHISKMLELSPLSAKGIVLKAQYLTIFQKDIQGGYDLLVEATAVNPTSMELTKAYALQCLDMNLESFAETILDELSYDLSTEDYNEFKVQYEEHKAIAEERFNNW